MYKRFSHVLGLAALLAIFSLATVQQAQAQTTYVSKLNGLCLAVRDGKIANSSTMMTWTCIPGDPAQTFYFSNGFMRIGSPNSQFCVASFNGLNASSPLGVWGCQNGPDGRSHPTQTFNLGMYQDLRISTVNLCLNVQGGNRAAGTPIILWPCSQGSQAGDMWQAQRAGGTAPPPPQAPPPPVAAPPSTFNVTSFHLVTRMGSRCLGVTNGNRNAGTALIQWDCLDQPDQLFQFMANGQIAAFGGSAGMCVDDQGGLDRDGDRIAIWPCTQSASRWRFVNGQIRAAAGAGLCLDLFGGWGGRIGLPNQWAQLHGCNNQDNQSWVAAISLPRGNSISPIQPGTQTTISPHYNSQVISRNGSASIIAQGGGNIIAQGGGNIIAQGGGNIIAQGGGNIIAQGGGNVLVPLANGIIAQGGGN